ncbi:MAG TPA: hypothetical protein DDW50_01570 [Firmicutes bacterium]|jgi:hypothetical protein|nr:hypothetical protein [Bacillota bacterium]
MLIYSFIIYLFLILAIHIESDFVPGFAKVLVMVSPPLEFFFRRREKGGQKQTRCQWVAGLLLQSSSI